MRSLDMPSDQFFDVKESDASIGIGVGFGRQTYLAMRKNLYDMRRGVARLGTRIKSHLMKHIT